MLHGDMRRYTNGRKKTYNAWGKTSVKDRLQKETTGSFSWDVQPRRRSSADTIKSVQTNSPGGCSKTERKEYTGTLVKGISTMHKSNAVPIINEQEMIEHAKMRR